MLRRITSDRISERELVAELDRLLQIPGVTNAWTMPVQARTAMLTTGIRTPLGLKISGDDPATIDRVAQDVRARLVAIQGARNVFAERSGGGYFLDIAWNRDALARAGLSIDEAQAVVQNAIGGETVSTVIEGRARYPVSVRYMADFRSDLDALHRLPVSTADGRRQIALGDLATVSQQAGPSMLRNENGLLTGYVYLDLEGRDPHANEVEL